MTSPTTDLKILLRVASLPLPFTESPEDIAAYIIAENPWGCVPYIDVSGPQEAIKIIQDPNAAYADISKKILEATTGAKRASAKVIRKLRAQQTELLANMASGEIVLRCNDPTTGIYFADISATEIRLRGYSGSAPLTVAAPQVTSMANLPPTISGVTPNEGNENETSTLSITGTNFKSGVSAQIIHDTKPVLVPNYIEITSSKKMDTNFSFPSGYAGVCDIKVRNQNNGQSILRDCFTIHPPANPVPGFMLKRTITVSGFPGVTVSNYPARFKIYLGWTAGYDLDSAKGISTIFVNTGNMKTTFDDLRVVGSGNSLLRVEREDYNVSYWGRFTINVPLLPPEGVTLTLYYKNPNAPALWASADQIGNGNTTIFTNPLQDWDLSGVASAVINGDRLDLSPKEGTINNPWSNGISRRYVFPENFCLEFVHGYSSTNANQNMGEVYLMLGDETGAKILTGFNDYRVGSGSPTGPLYNSQIEIRKYGGMNGVSSTATNIAFITRLNGTIKIYQTNPGTQDWTQKLLCTDTYTGVLNKIVISATKSGSYSPLIHKPKHMRILDWYGSFPAVTIGVETPV